MKYLLRSFIFTYIALYVTQSIIGGFYFGGNRSFVVLLVVFGLTLLNMFMLPIFKVISLPEKGPAYLLLSFILTLITLRIMTTVIPFFELVDTTVVELNIFGIMLPERYLSLFWSAVFSALLFTIVYLFMAWLCKGKSKKK